MHGLAHGIIAPERERQVGHAARYMSEWHLLADRARGLDEVDAVIVMLLDACRDGENIRIENNVLGRKSDNARQDIIGAAANLDLARERVGLPLFIECHDHDGGAMPAHDARLFDEFLLAFLQRDRIDDRLALHAFEASLDHLEFRGIDHDRHARDVGLGRDQIEEILHGAGGVEHALVHVDIDNLRAADHLFARHVERRRVFIVFDEFPETRRASDIGALADIDELDVLGERERL